MSSGVVMSAANRMGDMRAYSSGSSRCVAPWVTRNSVAMSELHSSLTRLFTARSLQMALKRSVRAGQPRRHVAAVAAAEHADPVGVGRGVAPQRLVEDGVHVVDVDRAPPSPGRLRVVRAADGLAPGRVAARRAAGVAHHDDVARARLDLGLVEEPVAVLGERAAVDVEQHGVALGRVEVRRRDHPAVDLDAVGRRGDEPVGRLQARSGGEPLGDRREPALRSVADRDVQLGRPVDRADGEGHRPAGPVVAGHDPLAADERLRVGALAHPVDVHAAAVLARRPRGRRRPRSAAARRGTAPRCGRCRRWRSSGARRTPGPAARPGGSAGPSADRRCRGTPPPSRPARPRARSTGPTASSAGAARPRAGPGGGPRPGRGPTSRTPRRGTRRPTSPPARPGRRSCTRPASGPAAPPSRRPGRRRCGWAGRRPSSRR